jgi:hypothetical protein
MHVDTTPTAPDTTTTPTATTPTATTPTATTPTSATTSGGNGWMWLLWLAGIPVAYWISGQTHSRVPIWAGMLGVIVIGAVLLAVVAVICVVVAAIYKAVTR